MSVTFVIIWAHTKQSDKLLLDELKQWMSAACLKNTGVVWWIASLKNFLYLLFSISTLPRLYSASPVYLCEKSLLVSNELSDSNELSPKKREILHNDLFLIS